MPRATKSERHKFDWLYKGDPQSLYVPGRGNDFDNPFKRGECPEHGEESLVWLGHRWSFVCCGRAEA